MIAVVLAALTTLGPAGDVHLRGDVQASQSARSTVTESVPDVARAELTVVPQLSLDTEGRLQLHLGWEPWTDLDTGVTEVLRWFRG